MVKDPLSPSPSSNLLLPAPPLPPLSDYCLKECSLPVLIVHRDMSGGGGGGGGAGVVLGGEAAPEATTPVSNSSELVA